MDLDTLEQHTPAGYYYDLSVQLQEHIYRRFDRLIARADAERDALKSEADVAARAKKVGATLIAGFGGLPPRDTPLQPRLVGEVKGDGYRIEKIVYQSMPGFHVPANVYVPNDRKGRGPAIYLCSGHESDPKGCAMHQIVAQYFVHAGFVVLLHDPIGQGERLSYWDPATKTTTVGWGTTEHCHVGCQGLTLAENFGSFILHECLRGVDYLVSRDDVDPARIGATGSSGGGMQTGYLMMTDPRIAAAAPSCWISDYRAIQDSGKPQDNEQLFYTFLANGFDHADILLSLTPKPVLVLAATSDFFPLEGAQRSVQRIQRLWQRLGRKVDISIHEEFSRHAYAPGMARAATEFFCRHLGLDKKVVAPERIKPFPPEQLQCSKTGQIIGEIAGAKIPHDLVRERVLAAASRRSALPAAQRRRAAIEWLRDRVHRNRKPCALNPRFYDPTATVGNLDVETCFWWSQEGIFNHGLCFRPTKSAGANLPVTIAVWDHGSKRLKAHWDWIQRTCAGGRAVVVLNVSGTGSIEARAPGDPEQSYGFDDKLADDLFVIDDDLAALRAFDVCRAVDMISTWRGLDASDIRIYGHGYHGTYARLAAAIEPRFLQAEFAEPMPTCTQWASAKHYDVPAVSTLTIRGCLNYFDLDELPLAIEISAKNGAGSA